MANSPNLGTLLIDPLNGSLLAMDALAAEELSISSTDLSRCNLSDFVPCLAKELRIYELDQNDNQVREFSTLITGTARCERSVRIRIVPLAGLQRNYLLLTIHSAIAEGGGIPHRDALTGLPDRHELVDYHQRWLQAAGENTVSLAVLFMDLDQFKQINDQHGHTVGDQVLVTLAERWQSCVRDGDLVVRYGGDEFVVLLAGVCSRVEVEPVIARLSAATAKPILIEGEKHLVKVTIGVAIGNSNSAEKSSTFQQLINAADRDMYAAKRSK